MDPTSRIRGLRISIGGHPLFDVSVVNLGLTGEPVADHPAANVIARTLNRRGVEVHVLAPPAPEADDASAEKMGVADAATALFGGVLRVGEDSTLLLRSYADAFNLSVFDFGRGEGLASVPGSPSLRTFTLANSVGCSWIGHPRVRLPLVIVPRKLPGADPLVALDRLVREVWERHLALVRRLKRPTTMSLGSDRGARRSPIQTLMLLDHIVIATGVSDAWDYLVAEPRTSLRITWPPRRVRDARHPVWFGSRGPHSIPGAHTAAEASRVRDRTASRTTDTPGNRLSVRVAQRIADLANAVAHELDSMSEGGAVWMGRARALRERADGFRHQPAMADVDTRGAIDLGAPALRLDPLYRPMARAWTLLEEGVALPPVVEPLFSDPLKESYELYE